MTITAELVASLRGGDVTVYDEFCGGGGSMKGIRAIPGMRPVFAANHDEHAIATHAANNPGVEHFQGDVQRADITKFPHAAFFWASPACPKWTNARGVERDFDKANQIAIPGLEIEVDETVKRSRALMEEVPRYLAHWARRGRPVLAGVVENVIECRLWSDWGRWRREIESYGYRTRLFAFNSMHAAGTVNARAPQSRDRLYLAYWHTLLGRDPDWDKWMRPLAHCERCDQDVRAVQVFKDPSKDMGRYRSQYVYRCPNTSCRGAEVQPHVMPAASVIDWSDLGTPIGERKDGPPKPKTMARLGVGILKFGKPMVVPAGGTWRTCATETSAPFPARTTRESDALAVPPLLLPVEGRPGKDANSVFNPARTQTTRAETALAIPPFIATLRGGGSAKTPHTLDEAVTTVSASGNHHGLALPPDIALLVPYFRTGTARPSSEPVGTLTTKDRYALARTPMHVDPEAITRAVAEIERIEKQILAIPESRRKAERAPLDDEAARHAATMGLDPVRFRMLGVAEVRRAMGAGDDYILLPAAKRDNIRLLGNMVTPPVAELFAGALMEVISGEQLERAL